MAFQKNNNNNSNYVMEEGSVSEKTNFVNEINKHLSSINRIASFPTMGSYVDSVLQLDAMLESYKDEKYLSDIEEHNKKIMSATKSFEPLDREAWIEQNAITIHRELFRILMRLMSRSGLTPTGRVTSYDIDSGFIA